MNCELCAEDIGLADEVVFIPTLKPLAGFIRKPYHRECMARSVIGGIGHLEDHDFWCVTVGDPDGGRTYRQSSLEAVEWVRDHQPPEMPNHC
jgi:hypothetical protein